MNNKEEDILNQIIADLTQMQTNLQQAHWYMRGEQFFRLHPLMDEYSDLLSEQLDNAAERLIALGGSPISTTHEFIDKTKISDEKITWGKYSLTELMSKLLAEFKILQSDYSEAIEIMDAVRDFPTQDMINDFKIQTDKIIWMISSFLGEQVK